MSDIFFTSDTHFSHTNTWALFKTEDGLPLRPFTSTEEMDEFMIEQWNKTVKPSAHVYHLGDISMKRPRLVDHVLKRLNGHKRLIRGNHDIFHTKEYLEYFDEIYGIRVMDNIIFTHIPIHPTSAGRFSANVHGHIHNPGPNLPAVVRLGHDGKFLPDMPYINITVEHTNYRPINLAEVKELIKKALACSA